MRHLQCALLAAVAAIGITSIASAADMPVKAAPIPMAERVYDWSGVYGGVGAGYAHNHSDWGYTNPAPASIVPFSMTGNFFIFGGHLGAQYQWSNVVVGVEGSLSTLNSYSDNINCGPNPTLAGNTCSVIVSQISTVGGRLGWAGWNGWLLYGQGGYASGNIDTTVYSPTGLIFDTTNRRQNGWYVGGGIDYLLHKGVLADLIVGLDYKHVDLRTAQHLSPADGFSSTGANARNIKATEDIVLAKFSLKFNPWRQ